MLLKKYLGVSLLLLSLHVSGQITDETRIVANGAEVVKLQDGYKFTEGPVADKSGNVFFTDQPNNTIIRWDAKTGAFSNFSSDAGRSNGMYFDKKGNLIACADMDNQIWSFDKKGKPSVIWEKYDNKALNGPNDLWITPKGGIFFTDPLYARNYWKRDPARQQDGEHVYYLTPDRKTVVRVVDDLKKPNGVIGTPDGKLLYIADIGAGKTYRYSIEKDGKLGNKTLFAEMGSDGLTIDEKGNVYLTGNGVTVFDPNGKQIAQIPVRKGWTANVCFGGKDFKTLFITAGDAVFSLAMNVKGAR